MNLFTYGSLEYLPLITRITGRSLPAAPASIHGFARYHVRDREDPVAIPKGGALITGTLYSGLSHADFVAIDDYLGADFLRIEAPAGEEQTIKAYIYIYSPELQQRLDITWDG